MEWRMISILIMVFNGQQVSTEPEVYIQYRTLSLSNTYNFSFDPDDFKSTHEVFDQGLSGIEIIPDLLYIKVSLRGRKTMDTA